MTFDELQKELLKLSWWQRIEFRFLFYLWARMEELRFLHEFQIEDRRHCEALRAALERNECKSDGKGFYP